MAANPLKVSVVIPVLNSPENIKRCLDGLMRQTYPEDLFEIIVVDNGSTDNTPEIVRQYPVKFLFEKEIRSPYAARNRGIKESKGEIIALIDAGCTPITAWLESGINTMITENADLVGGKVTFTFGEKKTISEIFDSISNAQIKQSIEDRGVAKGGNLFVRKTVFEKVGLFPENVRSGADVLWTGCAIRAGFKPVYSPNAEVFYSARGFCPLIKKSYRVGKGHTAIWKREGKTSFYILKRLIRGFFPHRFSFIKRILEESGTEKIRERWFRIWFVAWACEFASNLGRIYSFFAGLDRDYEFPEWEK
ncbi:glycosyltransferase AglE [bacterium]|nr:MAG: glycosyltransferase AglE [bacterium]